MNNITESIEALQRAFSACDQPLSLAWVLVGKDSMVYMDAALPTVLLLGGLRMLTSQATADLQSKVEEDT